MQRNINKAEQCTPQMQRKKRLSAVSVAFIEYLSCVNCVHVYLLAYFSCIASVICNKEVCYRQLTQESHSTIATDAADAT